MHLCSQNPAPTATMYFIRHVRRAMLPTFACDEPTQTRTGTECHLSASSISCLSILMQVLPPANPAPPPTLQILITFQGMTGFCHRSSRYFARRACHPWRDCWPLAYGGWPPCLHGGFAFSWFSAPDLPILTPAPVVVIKQPHKTQTAQYGV